MADDRTVTALLNGFKSWTQYVQLTHGGVTDYDFSGADLSQMPDLTNDYRFANYANFQGCTFGRLVLGGAEFLGGADFSGCHVAGETHIRGFGPRGRGFRFHGARFDRAVRIDDSQQKMEFSDCTFGDGLWLRGIFHKGVRFARPQTTILGRFLADGCHFYEIAEFNEIRVAQGIGGHETNIPSASFKESHFHVATAFENNKIEGEVNFLSAEFAGRTSFRGTVFGKAPVFYGAKLDAETDFDVIDDFDKQFPDTRSKGAEQRYRVLKNLMAAHNALGEQLGFARLEMRSHAARRSGANVYTIYGWLADYGLSWRRPLCWLGVVLSISWSLFSVVFFCKSSTALADSALLALHNSFPFVGVLKSFGSDNALAGISGVLKVAIAIGSVLQSLLSAVLLFLAGLGIRNRLRMK